MDDLGLVGDLALVGSAALLGGVLARFLGMPVILGYLAAGLLISPNTPGFEGDIETVRTIADLGVALLMFTIGIRFSLRELMQARDIGIIGGILQVLLVGAGGTLIGYGVGLSIEQSVVLGAVAALSSTMVALRMLEQAGEIGQAQGKIAVSISLVQDLAAVPVIVMIPVLAGGEENFAAAMGLAAGKGVALVVGVWIVGTIAVPRLLDRISVWRSRELFLLTIVVLALGTASISAVAGLSIAFGAFLAGLLVSESEYAHRTLAEVLPLREVFAVVFFVAAGMLIDPESFVDDPEIVLGVAAIGILGKAALVTGMAGAFGYSPRAAAAAALALANMGEFSFVLTAEALDEGLFDEQLNEAVLAGVLTSLAVSPFLFLGRHELARILGRLQRAGRPAERPLASEERSSLVNHAVICGFDEAGREVTTVLLGRGFKCLVIDEDPVAIRRLREQGVACILGDAGLPAVLEQAELERARVMVVTVAEMTQAEAAVAGARLINPRLDIVARGANEYAHQRLTVAGAAHVVHTEFEVGMEVVRHALHRFGMSSQEIQAVLGRRRQDIGRW
ncbi:MAG TPA: cation:proton antiporter [Dehalococcoidia bacterium]|nr:cation:proton antiporter [Dehalococcoidia bacterium]